MSRGSNLPQGRSGLALSLWSLGPWVSCLMRRSLFFWGWGPHQAVSQWDGGGLRARGISLTSRGSVDPGRQRWGEHPASKSGKSRCSDCRGEDGGSPRCGPGVGGPLPAPAPWTNGSREFGRRLPGAPNPSVVSGPGVSGEGVLCLALGPPCARGHKPPGMPGGHPRSRGTAGWGLVIDVKLTGGSWRGVGGGGGGGWKGLRSHCGEEGWGDLLHPGRPLRASIPPLGGGADSEPTTGDEVTGPRSKPSQSNSCRHRAALGVQ